MHIVGEEKPPLDTLAHFGVKGMKWGVRRERKRQAKTNFMNYYMKAGGPDAERRIMTPISEAEYKGLSSKPIKLGHDFNRVAANGKSTTKGRMWLHGGDSPYAKSLNDRELGFATYKLWAQQQEGLKTPLETQYFENLKKKGYNSVIDDADSGLFSDVPIILFPKESGARVTEVKPLTKDDVIDAQIKVKSVGSS